MERNNWLRVSIIKPIFVVCMLAVSGTPLSAARAHEGHHMTCNETGVNAMIADIQAMPDGEAKTKAMKEMDAAQGMMAKKNMEACKAHMHNAMEAYEE